VKIRIFTQKFLYVDFNGENWEEAYAEDTAVKAMSKMD
jgi:hypothetical protein